MGSNQQPMPVESVPDAKFHEAEGEIVEYRALSGLAITAFVLGLASALSLTGPLLLVIPVLGIATALLALRSIERNSGQLTGRGLAVAGLALAVLFGAATPARLVSRKIWIEGRAKEFAALYFEQLAAGNKYAAHQLTQPPDARLPLDERLEGMYSEELKRDLDLTFIEGSIALRLLELGENLEVTHVDTTITPVRTYEDAVRLVYEVTDKRDESAAPWLVVLDLARTVSIADNEQWQIQSVSEQ